MKILIGAALVVLSVGVSAAEPIHLEEMKVSGSKAVGKCGVARVSVSGLEQEFIGFDGRVEIVSNAKNLIFTGDGTFFQDWNTLACVKTPSGPMLVLRASCGGTSCIPDDYRVIDPKSVKVLSKTDPDKGCPVACAEKALGVRLPEGMRASYAP